MLLNGMAVQHHHHDLPTRFYLFGGKGGVGKTTLAAAHALRLAAVGERVLLVPTDPAYSVSDRLGKRLGNEPVVAGDGLWAMEIDPTADAERYVDAIRGMPARPSPKPCCRH